MIPSFTFCALAVIFDLTLFIRENWIFWRFWNHTKPQIKSNPNFNTKMNHFAEGIAKNHPNDGQPHNPNYRVSFGN